MPSFLPTKFTPGPTPHRASRAGCATAGCAIVTRCDAAPTHSIPTPCSRNGTSMISLILPPKSQISAAAKMLGDEYGTASNIKSRVNRQSVLGAITSTQQRLKLFNKVPTNGLVIYCGTILTEDNKEKKARAHLSRPLRPLLCVPPSAAQCRNAVWRPARCTVVAIQVDRVSSPPHHLLIPHPHHSGEH